MQQDSPNRLHAMSTRPISDPPFPPSHHSAAGVRRIGRINGLGVWTLYMKEVQRFIKVALQTIVAPIVTTLLFLTIFTLAIGGQGRGVPGIPLSVFLAPGLIMMAVIQNSFANTSSSMLISKVQGNIVDLLMPPLSAGEVTFAMTMGGATRGLVVALATGLAMAPFVPFSIAHWWAVLYFATAAAILLSLLGLLGGIWADKFDHIAAVTNFVVIPLSFLSGTFYSVERLPAAFVTASHLNPFFYLIDGFRYGFIGRADADPVLGAFVLFGLCAVLWGLCYFAFQRGWKLKS